MKPWQILKTYSEFSVYNGNRVDCERPYLEPLDSIATKHVRQPVLQKENHVKQ